MNNPSRSSKWDGIFVFSPGVFNNLARLARLARLAHLAHLARLAHMARSSVI